MSSDTVPVTQAASFAEWLKRYVGMQDANKMRFSVAELKIAFETGRATPTPSPAMPSREEIARIIAPSAWADPHSSNRADDRRTSLYRADAILALTSVDRASEAGWMPIETAPKDGREILMAYGGFDGHCPLVVAWSAAKEQWLLVGPEIVVETPPTHWRPLPEPPALSSIGSEAE